MNFDQLLEWTLAFVCAVIGWFLSQLWEAVKKLNSDISKLEKNIPENYIRKDDYRDDMRRIYDMLDKIYDKLDNKEDKAK